VCVRFRWGNLKQGDHLEDTGVDGRIILRQIFRKLDVGYGLDRAGSRLGELTCSCDSGNEPSGSIKCGEFLDQLRYC